MKRHSILLVVTAPALLVLGSTLHSYQTTALPGTAGSRGTIPTTVAQAAPACGQCHSSSPGGNGIAVSVVPAERSLALGQSIGVTVSATGGAANPLGHGGFVAEARPGTFAAGSNSRVDATGRWISHATAAAANNRTWSFGYTAASQPGPVELFAVVNTANGDGSRSGDMWAFHGADPTALVCTPVRLFVNNAGVTGFGAGCVGSFGNYPVLGAHQSPAVGNGAFSFEVVGAAPAAPVTLLFGRKRANPLDLGVIGMTGCNLLVDSVASLGGATGAGDAKRGEGRASLPFPIPNDAALRGVTLNTQAVIIDVANGRGIPVTLTNGLTVTVQ